MCGGGGGGQQLQSETYGPSPPAIMIWAWCACIICMIQLQRMPLCTLLGMVDAVPTGGVICRLVSCHIGLCVGEWVVACGFHSTPPYL